MREIDLTKEPTGTRVCLMTKSGSTYMVTVGSHADDDINFAHHLTIESDTRSVDIKLRPGQQGNLVAQKKVSIGQNWRWGLGFQTSPVLFIDVDRP